MVALAGDKTHAAFLEMLPAIKRRLRWAFRRFKANPDHREELEQQAQAYAWDLYLRSKLTERGPRGYAAFLVKYAIKNTLALKSATLGTPDNRRDVYSRKAQADNGFDIARGEWVNHLIDDRASVPETVACRIDYGEWLSQQPKRYQELLNAFALGHTRAEVTKITGYCRPEYVWAIRKKLEASWKRHVGILPASA